MLQIRDNYIYRGGEKIGWINGNQIYDHNGKKLGYCTPDTVYDIGNRRLAHIEGNHVFIGSRQVDIEDILSNVPAVNLSNIIRIAITTFLGN